MAYTIQINEAQRVILHALLEAATQGQDAFPADAEINEPALLRDMFGNLPAQELEMQTVHGQAPGESLHGFCL